MEKTESISQGAIYEYNDYIQSSKPEDQRQYSFEKLGIQDWEINEITGRELLGIHSFVESSGAVAPAYIFWKKCGKNSTLDDVIDEVKEREEEIPEEAKPWIRDILSSNFDKENVENMIKKGEIDPPLLFTPVFRGEKLNIGLLNLGNILDGNHRLQIVSRYLKDCTDEEIDNFRLTVFTGKVDIIKYIKFNTYYITEPWITKAKNFVRKFMGKDVEKIDEEHIMNFYDRWYLFLQRIGYFKKEKS